MCNKVCGCISVVFVVIDSRAWVAGVSAAFAATTVLDVASSAASRVTDRGDSGSQIHTDIATLTPAGDATARAANGIVLLLVYIATRSLLLSVGIRWRLYGNAEWAVSARILGALK